MVSRQLQSLCGAVVCGRMCVRSEHCQAGLARRRVLLAHLRARRQVRHRLVVQHNTIGIVRMLKAELERRES